LATALARNDFRGIHLQAGSGATEGKGRIHLVLLPGSVGKSLNLVNLAFVSTFS
jgi:hypothetical protein